MIDRRHIVRLAIAAGAAVVHPASAQEWPQRPITMVVGTAAGGGTDILARILLPRLSELLGQPVIVENIGHALTAASRVAKAEPDGSRFLLGATSMMAYPQSLYKNPPYNAVTDFAPVALVAELPFLLVARKDLPVDNLQGFAAFARSNQSRMHYGSGAGTGSSNHIVCELLNSVVGIKVTHVPYRDIGPATQDMIAGRIDYQCPLPGSMIPLIETKQVTAIANFGLARSPRLPNLATAHEQGLTDFEGTNWNGFFFPRNTPEAIVRKLHRAAIETIETPAVQQRLLAIAATPVAPERRSPEYLAKFVASEIEKWAVPIKASGASLD